MQTRHFSWQNCHRGLQWIEGYHMQRARGVYSTRESKNLNDFFAPFYFSWVLIINLTKRIYFSLVIFFIAYLTFQQVYDSIVYLFSEVIVRNSPKALRTAGIANPLKHPRVIRVQLISSFNYQQSWLYINLRGNLWNKHFRSTRKMQPDQDGFRVLFVPLFWLLPSIWVCDL